MKRLLNIVYSVAVLLCIATESFAASDISISIMDNAVYFQDTIVKPGDKLVMPLMMKNKMEVAALRFDICMPEGIEIDKNSRGTAYAITFNKQANRSDASIHSLSSALQPDGSVRVVCFSSNADIFLGNEGAILDFAVTVTSTAPSGKHQIVIKNIELTTPVGKSEYIDEIASSIEVKSNTPAPEDNTLKKGDMNEDGKLSVADLTILAAKILAGEE